MYHRFLSSFLASSALLAPAFAQDVHVLDAVNGPLFTIDAALAVAGDGDIVIVAPGVYPPGFRTIDGISLTLAAEDPANPPVFVRPNLTIQNIEAAISAPHHPGFVPGGQVTIRGITFRRTIDPQNEQVRILENEGAVVFEDCRFETNVGFASPGQIAPAVEVLNTASSPEDPMNGSVLFTRCEMEGGDGVDLFQGALLPGSALSVTRQGSVVLFECDVTGGAGAEGDAGAPAVEIYDGTLLMLSGGTVVGGAGGQAPTAAPCIDGSSGGAGVIGDGEVRIVDALLAGGAGGVAVSASCSDGQDGSPASVTGTVETISGAATQLQSSASVAQVGSTLTLDVEGPASSTVTYAIYVEPDLFTVPYPSTVTNLVGALVLGFQNHQLTTVIPFGFLQNGSASNTISVPGLGGVAGVTLHLQALVVDHDVPQGYWSAPTSVVFVE